MLPAPLPVTRNLGTGPRVEIGMILEVSGVIFEVFSGIVPGGGLNLC